METNWPSYSAFATLQEPNTQSPGKSTLPKRASVPVRHIARPAELDFVPSRKPTRPTLVSKQFFEMHPVFMRSSPRLNGKGKHRTQKHAVIGLRAAPHSNLQEVGAIVTHNCTAETAVVLPTCHMECPRTARAQLHISVVYPRHHRLLYLIGQRSFLQKVFMFVIAQIKFNVSKEKDTSIKHIKGSAADNTNKERASRKCKNKSFVYISSIYSKKKLKFIKIKLLHLRLSRLREGYVPEIIHEEKTSLKAVMKDQRVLILCDKNTDRNGQCVFAVLIKVLGCRDDSFCKMPMPQNVLKELSLITYNWARYMGKCISDVRILMSEKLVLTQCWAHKLKLVGNVWAVKLTDLNNCVRKHSYIQFLTEKHNDETKKPKGFPIPVVTGTLGSKVWSIFVDT
ncbi:hypothetical protein PR048_004587 [Dryococelus australis]|uniref:Uncharacterized protein n=1 Tax=Dryococelus australis TaxID=614101 RepID=A0ABQ9I5V5_9NEOP|nr:hypothetical protein PR048_004587 [Dryococelus australis]